MLPRQAVYMVPASFFNTWNCMGDNNFWNYMEAVQRPIVPIMQSVAIVRHFQWKKVTLVNLWLNYVSLLIISFSINEKIMQKNIAIQ